MFLEFGVKDVVVLCDGIEMWIFMMDLKFDDEFVVWLGEKIVIDGVIVLGIFVVDVLMLIGELVLVEVGEGDVVIGVIVNVGG